MLILDVKQTSLFSMTPEKLGNKENTKSDIHGFPGEEKIDNNS